MSFTAVPMKRIRREVMSNQDEGEDELESQQVVTGNKRVVPSTRKKRRGMIEKRRRDKINHLLAELRRLVPAAFEKQGSAKLEKAEILQMTVDYLSMLHARGLAENTDNSNKFIPLQSINDQTSSPSSNQAQNAPNLMLNQAQAQHTHNLHHTQQQQHQHQQQLQQHQLQQHHLHHHHHQQNQLQLASHYHLTSMHPTHHAQHHYDQPTYFGSTQHQPQPSEQSFYHL